MVLVSRGKIWWNKVITLLILEFLHVFIELALAGRGTETQIQVGENVLYLLQGKIITRSNKLVK